jgi:hypothetical protein
MGMTKAEFDAWVITMDAKFDDLAGAVAARDALSGGEEAAAAAMESALNDVATEARSVDLLAIEFKNAYREEQDVTPYVVFAGPVAGSTGVADDAPVSVTFSKTMDSSTLTSARIYLVDGDGAPAGPAQSGNPTIDAVAQVATLNFVATLTKDVDYKIHVTTGVTDKEGHALASAFQQATAWHTAA